MEKDFLKWHRKKEFLHNKDDFKEIKKRLALLFA